VEHWLSCTPLQTCQVAVDHAEICHLPPEKGQQLDAVKNQQELKRV